MKSKTKTVLVLEVQPPASDAQIDEAIADAEREFMGARDAVQKTWIAQAKAGRMLAIKRESCAHGQWESWLKDHMPKQYFGEGTKRSAGDLKAAFQAWYQTSRNWIKLADTIDRCPPDALERAHTVRQLFALAGMLPEGQDSQNGERPPPLPAHIVWRIKRIAGRIREEISGSTFRDWPDELRMSLRTELEPLVELYRELSA
jgi:hypothetical protein